MLKSNCNDATKLHLIDDFDKVLSLGIIEHANTLNTVTVDDADADKIEALINERAAAKKEKNFAKADEIRNQLSEMGIEIKDTREGTVWTRK